MMPLHPFMNQFGGGYYPTRTVAWCILEPFLACQFLKTSLSQNLGLKCRNQPPPRQSLQVILKLYHQPLLAMLDIGQQPLQVMWKTNNHSMQVILVFS
jgi:hypothetical protein